MEKLFERYVEYALRRTMPEDAVLTCGARQHHLVKHQGEPWFLLKPDFLLEHGGRTWVLDTKWKMLEEAMANSGDKYGIDNPISISFLRTGSDISKLLEISCWSIR